MKDGFTDARSRSVFSVPALARALRAGTQGGAALFDVVNLSHCFAATIEEMYEVAPFTHALVASPNYDYLLTEAPARIFATLNADVPSAQMARSVVQRLHEVLPDWMHPGLFVAVDAAALRPIKPAWDEVASAVLAAFDDDPTSTRVRLLAAYHASAKYDTTQCEPDWALRAPDALVDMHTFAQHLGVQFGTASPVGRAALSTTLGLSAAILENNSVMGRLGLPRWHRPAWCLRGCSPAPAWACMPTLRA